MYSYVANEYGTIQKQKYVYVLEYDVLIWLLKYVWTNMAQVSKYYISNKYWLFYSLCMFQPECVCVWYRLGQMALLCHKTYVRIGLA